LCLHAFVEQSETKHEQHTSKTMVNIEYLADKYCKCIVSTLFPHIYGDSLDYSQPEDIDTESDEMVDRLSTG
jgi:hypothetical protein